MDNKIFKLPAIKGIIGDWVYYQTVISFKTASELIDNNHSIREYKSLDDVLQRDLSKRSKKIKEYLIREKSRFFNSVIIGLYGENPKWYRFDFAPSVIPEMKLSDEILETIGILEFSGGEILFSIDGQHRIDGIKQALKEKSSIFENDELPVILIAHNDDKDGKKRTRRLFSEINTKAVRVSGLDDLITNEDDPILINARRLFSDFEYFKKDKFIALNKTNNIDADAEEFTTILNLKEVNRHLYSKIYKHNDFRPSDKKIEELYVISENFWNQIIINIPSYNSVLKVGSKKVSDYRNSDGGSMLFRPIGINILAESYANWVNDGNKTDVFWSRINKIDDNLNGDFWKDVLWDNAKKTIKKVSTKFTREYMKYLLNLDYEQNYVLIEFNKLKGIENEKDRITLPKRPN